MNPIKPRSNAPSPAQLASVAHFARLSRAFLLMDLFKRFEIGGPIDLGGVIHGFGTMKPVRI